MKKLLVVALVVVAAGAAWKLDLFEPAPAKAYRAHREAYLESKGYSQELVAQSKWSLDVERCETSGTQATITATEKTATIPPNAASFAFATVVTRQLEAELALEDGSWVVVNEEVVSEDVTTYQDRKNTRP